VKIAKITIEGESGERIELLKAPFDLDCTVGRCIFHGSDEGIYAHCPQCERWVCRGHWQEDAALCLDCARVSQE
jgi:hypothetical protein